MTMQWRWVGALVTAGAIAGACSGKDGKDGAVGPAGAQGPKGAQGDAGPPGATGKQGPQGEQGPAGPQGPPGESAAGGATGEAGAGGAPNVITGAITTSCLAPCHTFSGIVNQWKTSRHYATYIANLGGDEASTWTGAKPCGNCHAIDGIEQRVAGNVGFVGDTGPADLAHGQTNYLSSTSSKITESIYAGQATVAVVDCSTCHDTSAANDPHVTGKPYTPGSFPLRVPTGKSDYAIVEKSSAAGVSDGTPSGHYTVGNVCMWCHKSRQDVTNLISGTTNITTSYWGPHEGPDTDVFTGAGAYEFSTKKYTNSSHTNFSDGCVHCHMPAVDENLGVGNHSFYPQLSVCTECHANSTNFDVVGGQTKVKSELQRLREALDALSLLSLDGTTALGSSTTNLNDTNWDQDVALPQQNVSADVAGALYDYFVMARASAFGVHNPSYVNQILYDSIQAAGGDLSGITRPP